MDSAAISIDVAPNPGAARVATISIAGADVRVSQGAIPLQVSIVTSLFRSALIEAPASVAPGQVISIEGTHLCVREEAAGPPLPDRLGGCRVLLDGVPIRLYTVSPSLIKAILPQALTPGVLRVTIERYADLDYRQPVAQSPPFELRVEPISMAFLEIKDGDRPLLAVEFEDGQFATSLRPVHPGESVTLRLTGLGQKDQAFPDGTLPAAPAAALEPIQILVQGLEAKIIYAGADTQNPGLDMVRLELPQFSISDGASTVPIEIKAASTGQSLRYEIFATN
jgi:uncharacterized protein (TIGR03437 family)